MFGQGLGVAIPAQGPGTGFPGTPSRFGKRTIKSRLVMPTTTNSLQFGQLAVIPTGNTQGGYYQPLSDYLTAAASNAANLPTVLAGIAVRNVKTQLTTYQSLGESTTAPVLTTATFTQGATTITVTSATGIVAGQWIEGPGIAPGSAVVSIASTTVTISLATTAAAGSAVNVAFFTTTAPGIGNYTPGQQADVMEEGSITVVITNGSVTANGQVYIRTVANANIAGTSLGDLEAAADVAGTPTGTGTIGSTSLTVSSATGLAVGQWVSGPGIAANTFVTAISGTTITLSIALTGTISGANMSFSNTWAPQEGGRGSIVFATGAPDPAGNNVYDIVIKNRIAG